jgi:diacylglycerol O-acyltransferase / wax synthase
MEQLSGLDASFLYLETPTLHMQVEMITTFDPCTVPGGYSFSKMQAQIASRTHQAPVFRRLLVEVPFRLGHPVWVDDPEFDIDYHVRRTAIPGPGGLRELADLAGDIASRQLDRSKPLWEIWIVEGLEQGQIAVIAKMHHSTVDGMSGAALLSVLFDLEVDPGPEPEPPEITVETHIPSGAELISEALAARLFRPFEMTRDILRTGQRLLNVRRVRNEPEHRAPQAKAALPLSAPRTSFNGTLTRRRQVALTAIGLADVKRLKNATGTTVNDVVLAVCTGALRRFLIEGDELPDKPLVAVVPVSVEPDHGAPYGSNKVSSMFVQLPAHLDDPLERLDAIREGTKGAKEEHNALGADMLVNWAEHATPNTFAAAARLYSRMRLADRHRPIANLIVSNVPGPDFPLYLAGAEMLVGFPLGPVLDGIGVNITIMSYRGVLYWGIISCPETMPKVWQFAADVPLALDELLAAAGEKPATFRSEEAAAAARPSGVDVRETDVDSASDPDSECDPLSDPAPDSRADFTADSAPDAGRPVVP